ncbi:unnamed protein product [Thlaspi arvense]|uniref:TFA2 Winged helix domain-containing protein n=1 Tax=Thlaspi arvense TaxID=13288 RepID=A0AAU9T7M6_THLAR|nr:unnamed protein product [Thlaspi arvense]
MALNQQHLDKFKKQQDTLSSIASSAEISDSQKRPVKFHVQQSTFNTTDALVQMKNAIDSLFKTREAFTTEQIVDMKSLRKNPRAHFDGTSFSYKAKHGVGNKSELLSSVNKHRDGIDADVLKDAYSIVLDDLQALKDSGVLWLISNTGSKEGTAFPDGFKCEAQVGDEFKALYRDVEVPSDMLEVEKVLRRIRLKPEADLVSSHVSRFRLRQQEANKHDVKDKSELLSLVNKHPGGIDVALLKHAYSNVLEDLRALKDSGDIFWLISETISKDGVVYPDGFSREIKVSDGLKALCCAIKVEKELRRMGLKPKTDTAARRAAPQMQGITINKQHNKHKKEKKKEITKLTNVHLPELFQGLNLASPGT